MSTPGRVPIHLLDSSRKSVSAGRIPASKKSYTESVESWGGRCHCQTDSPRPLRSYWTAAWIPYCLAQPSPWRHLDEVSLGRQV